MNNPLLIPKPSDLEEFIHFLFEGMEGYMYVATKHPDHLPECTPSKCECWDQAFFEYPAQANFAIRGIKTYAPQLEVYIAPALFKTKSADKEAVKCTQVLWCDFDGNAPEEFELPPSYVIQSSNPGHEHTYWKLDTPLDDIETIEEYNRRLCYKYGADVSGWNANRVLRPPYTTNHKRNGVPVAPAEKDLSLAFNLSVFEDLTPAPAKSVDYSLWEKLDLPSLNDVIYQNKFGPDFKTLFEKNKSDVEDRSKSLTNMAFICAEAGLSDKEIYVVISHLATRWEKFSHHTPNSRARQLLGIIEHTRIKYPTNNLNELDQIFTYSPKTLLETDIQVEWAIEGMLMRRGVMLFSGPGGIGKSRMSMQFMAHLAMGVPFLHYKITEPMKIGFLSLEMGDLEVKAFLQTMYPRWVQKYPDKVHLMEENWQIIPFGEQLPLNTTMGQAVAIQYIEKHKWDGIFIDSIGSAIAGNLNSSEAIQPFTNFNDKIRKRYDCFLWYIHHFRKPPPGGQSFGGAEDNYGDVYLFNRATSNYTVTKAKDGLLRIRNPKNRHAREEEPYLIRPVDGSDFEFDGVEPLNILDHIVSQYSKKPNVDFGPPESDESPNL